MINSCCSHRDESSFKQSINIYWASPSNHHSNHHEFPGYRSATGGTPEGFGQAGGAENPWETWENPMELSHGPWAIYIDGIFDEIHRDSFSSCWYFQNQMGATICPNQKHPFHLMCSVSWLSIHSK